MDGQARGILRQALDRREVQPSRRRREELIGPVNVILRPGGHHFAGQNLETGLHGLDRAGRIEPVAGPCVGEIRAFFQSDQVRGKESFATGPRIPGRNDRPGSGQIAFLGNDEKRSRQERIPPRKKRVVTGGQPGNTLEINLLADPQPGIDIAGVPGQRTGIDPCIEAATRSRAVGQSGQDRVGLRDSDPEKALLRFGNLRVVCRVDVHPGGPRSTIVRHQISGVIIALVAPFAVGRTEQIAAAPDARDPAVGK